MGARLNKQKQRSRYSVFISSLIFSLCVFCSPFSRADVSAADFAGESSAFYQYGFWALLLLSLCLIGLNYVRSRNSVAHPGPNLSQPEHQPSSQIEANTVSDNERIKQQSFIEQERMASIKQMVASISHEIRTPIGVGVTAASHLQAKTEQLLEHYHGGQMTQPELEKYFEQVSTSANILLSNLQRSAELVNSFKRLSMERSVYEKGQFQLKAHLSELCESLSPALAAGPCELKLQCDENLVLSSYPGAVAQVFTNLIMNSVYHGCKPKGGGIISIDVRQSEQGVEVDFSDDGVGITAEVQTHLYDAFYTTNAEGGGSGLGMCIVADLIHGTLGGDIECTSQAPEGARFHISLPDQA